VRPLLAELADAHLVIEQPSERFALHDLFRAYATELAQSVDGFDERRRAVSRLLDHYVHNGRPSPTARVRLAAG